MSDTKKNSSDNKPESATKAKESTNQEKQVRHTEHTTHDLPPVSKQTAGGIGGAVVGGVVGGPIGAIIGGVAGVVIGNSSAAGERPIGRTVDSIKAVAEEPARKAYARISKAVSPGAKEKETGTSDAEANEGAGDTSFMDPNAKM